MIKLKNKFIENFDIGVIKGLRTLEIPIARFSIFVVYFWFGLLKFIGLSPAEPLVQDLFGKTLGFLDFGIFFSFFAIFEMMIGVLFLVRGFERLAIFFIGFHILATILPLILLTEITWQTVLVPTLAGQYIIKNILIAALAVVVGAKLIPMSVVK